VEGRVRRSLTDDYKRQAVDLVASSGRSVGAVARKLGLRDSVLRRWVELRGAGREPTVARRSSTQAALPSADQRDRPPATGERATAHGARHLKSRSRSLLEYEHEVPLHRGSPRRLPDTSHVRRARPQLGTGATVTASSIGGPVLTARLLAGLAKCGELFHSTRAAGVGRAATRPNDAEG
jgi:transposase-like protein